MWPPPSPSTSSRPAAIRALSEGRAPGHLLRGGGIPVYRTERNHLKGAAAVIDKDFASELLAEQLDADMLIILTAVGEGGHQLPHGERAVALLHDPR